MRRASQSLVPKAIRSEAIRAAGVAAADVAATRLMSQGQAPGQCVVITDSPERAEDPSGSSSSQPVTGAATIAAPQQPRPTQGQAPVNFYRERDAFGCFSNFSKHPVAMPTPDWMRQSAGGAATLTWPTSEHYFQAMKFAPHHEHALAVLTAKSPMDAAKMGRDRSRPMRRDWEAVKDDVMRAVVRAKFGQHSDIRTTLLSTAPRPLVEHTRNDRYWGDGGDGTGKNMLGRILVEVRAELSMPSQECGAL